MSEQLYCGAGRACITPPEEYVKDLPGLGPQNITGILDPLYVRVILIASGSDKAMLVSLDLDKAPNHDEFLPELAALTGVPEERILYFGIHTHTAPVMGCRPFEHNSGVLEYMEEKERDAFVRYTERIRQGLLEAAGKAVQNLQPARIGTGHGESYINVNRCCSYTVRSADGGMKKLVETGFNGTGPVNRDVFIIRFESLQGEPIAFFVNYACHNVVMFLHDAGDGGIHISHDMGGCVSLHMEERFPGSVAVWSSGAAGNINPIFATQNYFPQLSDGSADLSPFRDFDASKMLRDRLAGRHLQDILTAEEKIVCSMDQADISGKVAFVEHSEEGRNGQEDRIRLRMVRIGDIALVGVNGELFSTLGRIIIDNAPVKDIAVINHDCSLMMDNPGYVLDDETNALCREADEIRMPHDGFRDVPGYLPAQLAVKTKELFA